MHWIFLPSLPGSFVKLTYQKNWKVKYRLYFDDGSTSQQKRFSEQPIGFNFFVKKKKITAVIMYTSLYSEYLD